ncbi:DUF6478 family protein [Falsirhodobacter deserti]|uniref:DUF6478 family protein n=1 Tax=Falsirhodobacter deserti TaxID=1365611 RepID=UPI000FE2CCDC|nr:DUF6478 family protein [Falsirhodobacter deserti]
MAGDQGSWLERALYGRSLAHWADEAEHADRTDLLRLKVLRKRAWALRTHLDRLIAKTESRLRPEPAIERPLGTDWFWRPSLWNEIQSPGIVTSDRSVLCKDVMLFHDCTLNELGVQQIRNRDAASGTAHAMQIDVFEFRGGFLSLAIELPAEAVQGIRRKHLIGLTLTMDAERPQRVFARLNLRHGPNTEQLLAEIGDDRTVEFDLAYTKLNEARAEKIWLDLIFEDPRMNRIVLRDLTMIRRPRAEI